MLKNQDQNKPTIQELIVKNKWYFFIDFCIILLITFSLLYLFNLVPPEFQEVVGRYPDAVAAPIGAGELPVKIEIPEVGVNAQVYNTDSTSTAVLDDFLLHGAVRWPGSGLLGQPGNVYLFGHSTGYKIVNNQAFKTFVGLKNLKPGDPISVFSGDNEYVYAVISVEQKEASDVIVNFDTNQELLTLSTCDVSISDPGARYVVQAKFVSETAIPQTQ